MPRDITARKHFVDFPALIRLSVAGVNGFSYNGFLAKDLDGKSTGYDLRAFDANGRILPYEIENWDPEGVSKSGCVPTI